MSTATLARRGTTNRNARGGSLERLRRRLWLVETYRADSDAKHVFGIFPELGNVTTVEVPLGTGIPACRCYRCGCLLTVETVSADRIKPGCQGGTYRRDNIRPACGRCQSVVGGATRSTTKKGVKVPASRTVRNSQRQVQGRGGNVAGVKPAERKDAPCGTCGARPGHPCYTLTSVKQVKAGREGAYFKTQRTLHTGRGIVK